MSDVDIIPLDFFNKGSFRMRSQKEATWNFFEVVYSQGELRDNVILNIVFIELKIILIDYLKLTNYLLEETPDKSFFSLIYI